MPTSQSYATAAPADVRYALPLRARLLIIRSGTHGPRFLSVDRHRFAFVAVDAKAGTANEAGMISNTSHDATGV